MIVEWIVDNAGRLPLLDLLKFPSAASVIFMRQLLSCAIRLRHTRPLKFLIQVCTAFDDPGRILQSYKLLYTAISYNQLELASRILDTGLTCDKLPFYLDVIAKKGLDEMLKLLLSRGLQLDKIEVKWYWSLLDGAVKNDNIALVKLLVNSQPNVIDISGGVLLNALVLKKDIAEVLVRGGVDIHINFNSDLETIVDFPSPELLPHYPIQYPLQVAAQAGNWDLVKCLVEHGASIDPGDSGLGNSTCEKWVNQINKCFYTDIIPVVSALQAAVRSENMDMIRFLLTKGASVDARPQNKYGHTALQIAVAIGNERLVNLLLESGANVNADPGFFKGATALQFAAGLRRLKIYNILIRNKARVTAKPGKGGKTVLQNAAAAGNIRLVRVIVQHRQTDVNEPPDAFGGRTALQAASESDSPNSLEIMRLLLSAGADSNGPPAEQESKTALQSAAGTGNMAKVELLLASGAQLELYSEQYGSTTLHRAIENRDTHMVAFLLQRGANPFSGPSARTGWTPLQEACWNGDIQIVSLLLSWGPPNLQTVLINYPANFIKGVTALQAAIHSRNLELTKLLLGLGADANAPGASIGGSTAMQRAIKAADFKALRLLLENGARFPADCDGLLPLDRGLYSLSIYNWLFQSQWPEKNGLSPMEGEKPREFIRLVMDTGLDITTIPTVLVRVALRIAIDTKNHVVVDTILSSCVLPMELKIGEWQTGLLYVAYSGDMETAKMYIEHGANINEVGGGVLFKVTALSVAVRRNHVDLVKYLLAHGADVELVFDELTGRTALQTAAKYGNLELVRLLVETGGANINTPAGGHLGRTPLQRAAQAGHIEIVRYLLACKAEVNALPSPRYGVTALQAAAISGHAGIVLILLEAGADVTAPAAATSGRTAIEGAAEHGRLDVLCMLLQIHPPGQDKNDQLKRAESLAEENGHTEIVRVIRGYQTCQG
ncbi:hypothetical protein GX51_06924 [Blastomyces parvus]|uniref:Uncharacterized protein n=1 Tax=Blastomyces parvus TaxID=2060905 RepID=A0A2B7WNI0_9EURO|nr:hypothetical protein GX51_06924 [Blastomyces parvus]